MKKVLFMVSSMNIGGVEKSLLSLLSAIPLEKYDITLLLLEKKGGFLESVPHGIKIEEVSWYKDIKPIITDPPQKVLKKHIKDRSFLKALYFLCNYIFSEKLFHNRYFFYKGVFKNIPEDKRSYDLAISYQGPTDMIDYYITHKVNARKKISWVHFDVSKHFINQKLYKRLYKKFNKVFVVSHEAKRELVNKIPSAAHQTEVFMNIISKHVIHRLSKEPIAFDDDYTGIKIVTVGRLSKEKGQDLGIKVLARLKRDGYHVRWYCIGDGSQRDLYQEKIEQMDLADDFFLLGSTPNPYPYIAGADIYVQTSRHEGYCLTLAEARCLHKPIVTTNFTGAQEQIIDGTNGWIVEFDEQELYEKIKNLIDEEEKRQAFSTNLSENNVDTTDEISKLLRYVQ